MHAIIFYRYRLVFRAVINPATVEVLRHVYKVRRRLLMLCETKTDSTDVASVSDTKQSKQRSSASPEMRARLVALPNSVVRAHDSDQSASEQEESDVSLKALVPSPKSVYKFKNRFVL